MEWDTGRPASMLDDTVNGFFGGLFAGVGSSLIVIPAAKAAGMVPRCPATGVFLYGQLAFGITRWAALVGTTYNGGPSLLGRARGTDDIANPAIIGGMTGSAAWLLALRSSSGLLASPVPGAAIVTVAGATAYALAWNSGFSLN